MSPSSLLRLVVTAALLVLLFLLAAAAAPAQASPLEQRSPTLADESRLVLAGKGPAFLLAVNYEGPADRAWQMWEDGKFDARLIEADLRRAREAGFSAVRVFVQAPLAADIRANRWDKLDAFLAMAERQGLGVILCLCDYGERDLAKVAELDGRIAARYAGNGALIAYDLKNEPHFSDLASAVYPDGARTPLQVAGPDEQLKSYQQMLADAGEWVTARSYLVSTLDYLDSPEGRRWDTLLGTLSASLAMWLQPQVDAIRKADNRHPITVAYSDIVLARLPANRALDYVTVHRYPNPTPKGVEGVARVLNNIRSAFPGKPVILGEFGFSNSGMLPEESASYETAMFLLLLSEGLGGGAKWMLNDFPKGFNPKQNAYGAYQADGSGKPVVAATRGLADYLSRSHSTGGHIYLLDKPSPGYRWAYEADDAFIISAAGYRGTRLSFQADRLSQLFLTWADPNVMRIYATSRMDLDLDPAALVRDPGMGGSFSLIRVEGSARIPVSFNRDGSKLQMSLEGDRWYELALPRSRESNPSRPQDYDIPSGHFFTQANGRPLGASATGFAVTDEDGVRLWSEFRRLGGVDALGYPVTHRFVLDGFVTQAFQKGVLQWRPEAKEAYFLNTFDLMHDRGLDGWLLTYRQTPARFDTKADTGLPWDKVVARHLAFLDTNPAIKARFLSDPDWLQHYGLPVAHGDMGNCFVIRAQRAVFQYWKEDVPWAKKGEVTVANGGDLAKEAYLWPVEAMIPGPPPAR